MLLTDVLRFFCRDCGKPAKAYWAWLYRLTGEIFCLDCSEKYWHLRDKTKVYKK